MDAILVILDVTIAASSLAAGAAVLAVLAILLKENRTQASHLRQRRRRHRERLKRSLDALREPAAWDEFQGAADRDLRRGVRQRVFFSARVALGGGATVLDCSVIDLSSSGARLAFGHAIGFAAGAELALEIQGGDQLIRARVAWSRATQCGVRFSEPEAARPVLASWIERGHEAA